MNQGPFEFSSEIDTSSMLNLGAVFLPNIPGLEVHLDLDPRSGIGKSVSLHLNMTIAEVQIFAAAINEDLWASMRAMRSLQDCANKKLTALLRWVDLVLRFMPSCQLLT